MTKSTVSAFHKALKRHEKAEEHSLSLLRRLLALVSLSVLVLSVATTTMSKTVVMDGVSSAVALCLGGDRAIQQQVCVPVCGSVCYR